jgi:branched-chain amino acid transport system substrate-binding protein
MKHRTIPEKSKTCLSLTLVIILLITIMTGCLQSPTAKVFSDRAKSEKLKIGVILPLTGSMAYFGEHNKNAINLALKELGNPDNIQVFWEDHQGSPQEATKAANKLISLDGVSIILSSMSSPSAAIAKIADDNKVIHIYISSLDEPAVDYSYVFKDFANMKDSCTQLANKIKSKGYGRIGFLGVKMASFYECAEGIKEKTPLEIEEWIEPGEKDLATALTKIKDKQVDFLILGLTKTETEIFLGKMSELNLNLTFGCPFYDLLCAHPSLTEKYSHLYEGSYATSVYNSNKTSETMKFFQSYYEEYGVYPTAEAAFMYDDIMMISTIQKKCSIDTECIKNELLKISNYSGAGGNVAFDQYGRTNRESVVIKYEAGEWK